ncbi:MAG: hypothetical protein A2Y57_02715 [Candidatus Woykebacteria bacterium RBG_13_40_7b]|uniref:Uncharacterized protein n=1 Tax=Candidatus Woykebacteria bacterium RBG_13_40_7b TaxID=1802594 RepID=A0A1G1WBJ0_9BACT|nr:MAG: hypothetical protein A2Y57_02715 [Candidatus Woykebacteria bacterium RBG_13_40_7b]
MSVDTVASTIKVESTHPSGVKKTWNLFISQDTILTTFKSLSKPSEDLNLPPSRRISTDTLEKLSLTSFKAGDVVYVTATDDLANNIEIKNVSKVLLQ